MAIFPMRHLVMLPPLFLRFTCNPLRRSLFCACIILLSFFLDWKRKEEEKGKKEKGKKKKGGYDGEVALASKVKLLQHGRGDWGRPFRIHPLPKPPIRRYPQRQIRPLTIPLLDQGEQHQQEFFLFFFWPSIGQSEGMGFEDRELVSPPRRRPQTTASSRSSNPKSSKVINNKRRRRRWSKINLDDDGKGPRSERYSCKLRESRGS